MSLYLADVQQRDYNSLCDKFQEALKRSPDRKKALLYLKKRGYNWDLIEKFKIGWCPYDANIRENLKELRGRVIFPTIDEYSDVRSFSGRLLKDKSEIKDNEARWWNEPYPKTFFLYGMNVAIPNIIKKNQVIIVEGQTDVIACHANGLDTAIGLMHDDLNISQISKLLRFTRNFILLLDGDSAGRAASEKIMKKRFMMKDGEVGIRLPTYEQIKVFDINIMIGDKKYDPDTFIQELGVDELKNRIKKVIKNRKK